MNRGAIIAIYVVVAVLAAALIVMIVLIAIYPWRTLPGLFLHPSSGETIAFYCGDRCPVKFNATSSKLGGSETAVVSICREWQNMGYQVYVFGNVSRGQQDGVLYIPGRLPLGQKFNHLILWRLFGVSLLSKIRRDNYHTVILDLHDGDSHQAFPLSQLHKCDAVMLKSEYQKTMYDAGKFPISQNCFRVIPNGVTDIEEYRKNREIIKDPLKFVYTSCYLRGLEGALKISWPIILKRFPNAKLHLFYGMELVHGPFKDMIRKLIASLPSVEDHGRMDRSRVRKMCADAHIHFYPCVAACEIDCISCKETALAGIIPVIPNSFVFSERAGVHFDGIPNSAEFFRNAASAAIRLVEGFDSYQNTVSSLEPSLGRTVMSWRDVAQAWTECFKK